MVGVLSAAPAHAASPNNQAQQQLILAAPPQQVFAAATQAFEQWSRGEVVAQDPATMQVKGLSRTKFFKFVDDITVSIQPIPTDPSQTQVSIQSVGRMGEYDFGGNQRNITEYLGILKTALKLT